MEKKQNIEVKLYVKEIVYDIMNKTHLTGHSREAEGKKNYETASYMQASEDAESSYQIRRSISNAFASIKERLGEYLNDVKSSTDNQVNAAVDAIDIDDEDKLPKLKEAALAIESSSTGAMDIKGYAANPTSTFDGLVNVINNHLDDLTEDEQASLRATIATLNAGGTLVLAFKLPSNFHNASVDSLGSGCHQYLVNRAISDWFVITNPEEAQMYASLSEEALETAKRALYKRARPVRPSYSA